MANADRPATAGIDRWRGGWIVAASSGGSFELWSCEHIGEAVDRLGGAAVVAIDMPIALVPSGRRSAEAELRSALGVSARSVFTSPTRQALDAPTQAHATIVNRANDGPGISAQAYGLFASIRELRETLRGTVGQRWWETHPETAFALMNDGTPLASKRSGLGVAQRLDQLRTVYADLDHRLLASPAKVPVDDVLDALAALWSAERIAAGKATVYGPADRDDEGFARGIRI